MERRKLLRSKKCIVKITPEDSLKKRQQFMEKQIVKYIPLIRNTIQSYSYFLTREDREDIVQNILLDIWERIYQQPMDNSGLSIFIKQRVVWFLTDLKKRSKIQGLLDGVTYLQKQGEKIVPVYIQTLREIALEALHKVKLFSGSPAKNPKKAFMFTLGNIYQVLISGFTIREVAENLGVSPKTVIKWKEQMLSIPELQSYFEVIKKHSEKLNEEYVIEKHKIGKDDSGDLTEDEKLYLQQFYRYEPPQG